MSIGTFTADNAVIHFHVFLSSFNAQDGARDVVVLKECVVL